MHIPDETFETHLDQILGSAPFKAAPMSRRLLQYLVRETLAGREDRLKGYSIGIDVFERGPDFDAAGESVVRVQVGRLRKLLSEFYASDEGQHLRQRIEIPKGQYVPKFTASSDNEQSSGEAGDARSRAVWSWAIAGCGALLASVLLLIALLRPGEAEVEQPRLFVAAYRLVDIGEAPAIFAEGLQKELVVQLSHFPDLAVIGFDTVDGRSANLKPAQKVKTDYILGGTVENSGNRIKVTSILTRSATDEVIWSSTSTEEMSDTSDLLEEESRIALRVASELGQSYGVIQQSTKAAIAEGRGVSLRQYRCILSSYDYMRSKSAARHGQVRACLEDLVRGSPHYANAWGLLSWIYGDESRLNFNRRRGEDPILRALRAARTGVEKNPTNAVAQQFLGIALFYSGNEAAALQTMRTALRLSPNNAEILANTGWIIAQTSNGEEARTMIERAIELNPAHPPWYWGGLAIHALRRGEAEDALRFSRQMSEDDPLTPYLLAAAFRMGGNEAAANQELARAAQMTTEANMAVAAVLHRHNIPADLQNLILGKSR